MDYEHEADTYDEEVDAEIYIGFKIIHPLHKFQRICNVSFNTKKNYAITPRLLNGNTLHEKAKVVITNEIENCKKILIIKSCKYIITYFDNFYQS